MVAIFGAVGMVADYRLSCEVSRVERIRAGATPLQSAIEVAPDRIVVWHDRMTDGWSALGATKREKSRSGEGSGCNGGGGTSNDGRKVPAVKTTQILNLERS